jgi:DNA polymerase-3 subunit delta'
MARILDQIIGHEKTKASLQALLSRQQFFSGAIFSGPEGIGKKKLALACLQELNCLKLTEEVPEKTLTTGACGECENCLRIEKNTTSGESGFLHLIEPEKDKIKIEQIREAIQFVSLQSWVKHRFIIMDQVEKISTQGANALLKSLEEPPEGVHFIFITSSLSQVLPTIRSRCQVVGFEALHDKDLQALCPDLETWQKFWCFGRLSLANKIRQPEWLQLRQQAINFLHNSSTAAAQKELSEQFSDGEKVDFIVHCWLTYIRDAMVFAEGGRDRFYNSDIVSFIEKFSRRRNLRDLYDMIYGMRRDYLGHVDKNLIVENFSINLLAER